MNKLVPLLLKLILIEKDIPPDSIPDSDTLTKEDLEILERYVQQRIEEKTYHDDVS